VEWGLAGVAVFFISLVLDVFPLVFQPSFPLSSLVILVCHS
jgi:hypothetical protein